MTKSGLEVYVLGAGGHGRVVADAWLAAGGVLAGIIDLPARAGGAGWHGLPVRAEDEWLRHHAPAEALLLNGIGATASTAMRRAVHERLVGAGFHFATVIHPTAIVAGDAALGAGIQLMAGVIVQTGAAIGANAIVNSGAIVDHDCVIGAHSHIAPGVVLSGGVRIGDGAHVGTGACVIQGLSIGAGAMVAAGAVVVRDVEPGERVAGVPARAMAQR